MKLTQILLAALGSSVLSLAMACGGVEDDTPETSEDALCRYPCPPQRPLCVEQKRLFELAIQNQDTAGIISADNRYTQAGCGPSLLAAY